MYEPARGRREKATLPRGQVVARDCGGIGIVVAAGGGVVDDAASAAVGVARAVVTDVVVMAVAMDTKDSMASRRDGCC